MAGRAEQRLAIFPSDRFDRLPKVSPTQPEWPALEGQLAIVFTSRAGSTFLCRHIEKTRTASGIAEAFNEPQLDSIQKRNGLPSIEHALARRITRAAEGGWFVAKAGMPGLAIAEHVGHMTRYIDVTYFWFLLRRDILAQAVSNGAAKISGQFHSTQPVGRALAADDYDEAMLLKSVRNIVGGCESLFAYLEAAERPVSLLFYEDFSGGDFRKVDSLLDMIGLPIREEPPARPPEDVHRMKHGITSEWIDRLRNTPATRIFVDRYDRLIERAVARFG